jgi:thiol-disulfide isomerase/thioredoxin
MALMVALVACTPGKEDKPPAPKVTASAESAAPAKTAAAQTPAAENVAALPRMGAAPAWKLQDLDGKVVTSEQLKGKVVVFDFWATWCPPCRAEIPDYIAMQNKYGKDGLVIVGASLDQAGPEVVKAFAGKTGVNYTMLMADESVVGAFGGVNAIPTTFLIDRDGQVRYRKEGLEEDFEKKVAAVVAEKA